MDQQKKGSSRTHALRGRRRENRKTFSTPGIHKSSPLKEQAAIPSVGENIRFIPLGGVEEIGMNMNVIEIGEDIIVIDAGFKFKEDDTPGIDYILPNTKYLEERKDRIR